jgi:hypothetical protein
MCANIWLISSMYFGLHLKKTTVRLIIIIIELPFQESKILKQQSFSKLFKWEQIWSMWAERQTDRAKLIFFSRNFTNDLNISQKTSVIHNLCGYNRFVCASDSSCFVTVIGMWYWVTDWYKCCVLQTAVASLQSADCDTEWLIGINVVCCRQQLLRYSQRIVILSGWLV